MTIQRSGSRLLAALVLVLSHPAELGAQTLSLDFAPPDIVVEPVCVPRSSDADLIAEWGSWDGQVLPDRDIALINRDMRRLAEIDPLAWDETITQVISLLPNISSSFSEDHATLAIIEHMIALGQLQELRTEGLVQKLLDRGDQNSPRTQNALAGYLNEGIGIDRDTTRGAELLVNAGYGGNADALLTLSHLAVVGNAPDDWNISPDLAVTMAFGSLVGQIDPLICDRIARIAREFSNGGVVSVNHDLAERWYRFAADLGDPIAAWRVSEYQMRSEDIVKDNDVLITYLTKAAAGNLFYAQIALGRVYESGALVPMDIAKAQALYEAAAAGGARAGLIRLSGFLEAQLVRQPALKEAFLDTLFQLEHQEDTPSWVYAKLAAHTLEDQGRWAGQETARALLERGADLQDPVALVMLAKIKFGDASTEAQFYEVVDSLAYAVSELGEVAPTAELQAAFLCKAPDAPLLEGAAYWADVEASIGSSSLELTVTALAELASDPDPLVMATLQTQALYGRATPLANLLEVLERNGSPETEVAFWETYADRFVSVATARAALALDQAADPAALAAALDQFRAAVIDGEPGAALKLAKALLRDADDAERAEAAALLIPIAQAGSGEAMQLLQIADPVTYTNRRAVFDMFSDQIDTRGDFLALMIAMPFLNEAETWNLYYRRAITTMECDFPEALAFASVMAAQGNLDEARRWLRIADHLAGDVTWQIVQLGDSYNSLLGEEAAAVALAHYETAYALGSRTAVQRLLRIYGDPEQQGYDQALNVSLYSDLIARSDPGQIPAVLDQLRNNDDAIRDAVEAQFDIDQLYERSAEDGNPVAMRQLALRLRANVRTPADVAESTQWLVRAAEAGDVPAMVLLAQAYSVGIGVSVSLDNARTWLEKAADAGDPAAINMMKLFEIDLGANP